MPEFVSFLQRLRHDLGKRYSVAQEQNALNPGQFDVLVRRRGAPETLCVTMETRWLTALDLDDGRSDTRVEYKHMAVLIRRFFDQPHGLPRPAFDWPGSQDNREGLRRALDPRQGR